MHRMHILQAASSTYAGILVTIILTLRLAEAGYDQTLYPFGKDGTASAGGGLKAYWEFPTTALGAGVDMLTISSEPGRSVRVA